MALIIEDGSLPPGANSYTTVAAARAYAEARAATFPADDVAGEVLAIKAMDYIEALRGQFVGSRYSRDQALSWPREGVTLDGFDYLATEVPALLADAQRAVMIEIAAGLDVMPTGTGKEVIRKKIGELETEWAAGSGNAPTPVMRKVNALLRPLLGGSGMTTVRI